eukprot:jgi/Mesen1/8626/ME000050S08037
MPGALSPPRMVESEEVQTIIDAVEGWVYDGEEVVLPEDLSAVITAAEEGDEEALREALTGAAIDVRDEDGATPLHDSSAGGYEEVVDMLLAAAAGDEQRTVMLQAIDVDGDIPLHHAARGNHVEVVKKLLQAGALAATKNLQDKTPGMLSDPGSDAEALLAQAMAA